VTTVVKLGGSLLEEDRLRALALDAIAAAWDEEPLVLVHGGGKHIDAAMLQAGIPKRTAGGLRVTDEATLKIVVSVLAGSVNKSLVAELASRNVSAVGLSGADGGLVQAALHPPIEGVDLGSVGKVIHSDARILHAILESGSLPVIASLALGPAGGLLNVNADSAAAAIAAAVGSSRLIFLTDVEGVLDSDSNVVPMLSAKQTEAFLGKGVITGGMRPKLGAALQALRTGVHQVIIAGPSSHQRVLSGGAGGTQLVAA